MIEAQHLKARQDTIDVIMKWRETLYEAMLSDAAQSATMLYALRQDMIEVARLDAEAIETNPLFTLNTLTKEQKAAVSKLSFSLTAIQWQQLITLAKHDLIKVHPITLLSRQRLLEHLAIGSGMYQEWGEFHTHDQRSQVEQIQAQEIKERKMRKPSKPSKPTVAITLDEPTSDWDKHNISVSVPTDVRVEVTYTDRAYLRKPVTQTIDTKLATFNIDSLHINEITFKHKGDDDGKASSE